MKSKLIERPSHDADTFMFVDSTPIDDPACMRDENDPASAFAQYLLPKLKHDHGDASREVLMAMKSGRSLTDAILDTIESLSPNKTKKLRTWVDEASSTRVFTFALVPRDIDREHVRVGVLLTTGGPKDYAVKRVSAAFPEYVNGVHYQMVHELRAQIANGYGGSVIHSTPLVYVDYEHTYESALEELGLPFPYKGWSGQGLYDFSKPWPEFLGTMEVFARARAEKAAREAISAFLRSGEIADECERLRER
jgi:hypothetical protein